MNPEKDFIKTPAELLNMNEEQLLERQTAIESRAKELATLTEEDINEELTWFLQDWLSSLEDKQSLFLNKARIAERRIRNKLRIRRRKFRRRKRIFKRTRRIFFRYNLKRKLHLKTTSHINSWLTNILTNDNFTKSLNSYNALALYNSLMCNFSEASAKPLAAITKIKSTLYIYISNSNLNYIDLACEDYNYKLSSQELTLYTATNNFRKLSNF